MTTLTEGDTLTYRGNEYTVEWVSPDDDGNPRVIGVSGPYGCYAGIIKDIRFKKK